MQNHALPIERPGKIVCVGLNYRDHAAEAKLELPDRPLLFAKWQSSLIGPGAAIEVPHTSTQVDYEAELGVVISRRVRRVAADDALDAVRGYVCVNEVSDRAMQFQDGQWTRAKSADTFCPVGPALVPAEKVADPQRLRIRCLLNGEAVQDSTTADMVFTVAQIIAYASSSMTLEPGDLIATGTPAGVGLATGRYLRPGDEVSVDIEGVGTLTNPVQAAPG